MSNFPPEHCPYCGAPLEPVEEPTAYYCPDGDRMVFHNPTPSARVIVLDGDRFLLVKQGVAPVEGKWVEPGGKIEVGNSPPEHAAIELEEETGLRVDPADLTLVDVVAAEVVEDHHVVSVRYAVPADRTTGSIEAGDDAAEARFWTVAGFRDANLDDRPEQVRNVTRLYERARAALDAE